MLKKLILTFFILMFSLFSQVTFADSIPAETIFADITKDYKYLKELQALYDKGMIYPDRNGNFNPGDLLNRDEFIGILMEVTCVKCIKPNTILDIINKYDKNIQYNETRYLDLEFDQYLDIGDDGYINNGYIQDKSTTNKYFYDITKESKYFYCVTDALNKGFTAGYYKGITCDVDENIGVTDDIKNSKRPFCSSNTIILEEAIAIVLRASGILTNEEAEKIRNEITNGGEFENISDDVMPRNDDDSVYTFYPDLKKALEFEIVDVDIDGNVKSYTLIETINGKLNPKQEISKEQFLKIAYVTLKANSCEEKVDNNLALKMLIYDESCTENETCNLSDLSNPDNIYDFTEEVYTTCEGGISNPEGYIWRFYNKDTGEIIKKYGKYLDNYGFLSYGEWTIFLRVIDKCGSTAEVYNTINIKEIGFALKVDATPVYGKGPLESTLIAFPEGGNGDYTCTWNYGDGNTGEGIEVDHTFTNSGLYEVETICVDGNGLSSVVKTSIYVYEEGNEEDNTSFGLEVDATPIYGRGPLDSTLIAYPKGGDGNYTCAWDFGDGSIGDGIEVDHEFVDSGIYEVITTCVDGNGLLSTATTVVQVYGNNEIDLKVSIDADRIYGDGPLLVNFEGVVFGGEGPYTYLWDFGDGNDGFSKNTSNIFLEEGIYEVTLTVIDSQGRTGIATVLIQVIGNNKCDFDYDNDGVLNCNDLCPLIKGDSENKGCPILENTCNENSDCPNGSYCTGNKVCLPKVLTNSCEYSGGDAIFGNIILGELMCSEYNYTLDFMSSLRKCDIIFPAITSPDSTQIYSKGELFQIK